MLVGRTVDRLLEVGGRETQVAATEIETQMRGRLRKFRFGSKVAPQERRRTLSGTWVPSDNIAAVPKGFSDATDAVEKADGVIGQSHGPHL
jgi:hypothetical protein